MERTAVDQPVVAHPPSERDRFEADGVLHDVRGLANSLGLSAAMATEALQSEGIAKLGMAVDLLRADGSHTPADDPASRQALAAYLEGVHRLLCSENARAREAVERLATKASAIVEWTRTPGPASWSDDAERCSPDRVLVQALGWIAEETDARGIVVEHRPAPDCPQVAMGGEKLLRVLVNGLWNAAESIERGSTDAGRIRVSTRPREDGVRIVIRDDGAGFEGGPEEPSGPRATTKRPARGHGVGLRSARALVENAGGALTLTSRGRGRGATLRLDLPRVATFAGPHTPVNFAK